MGRGRSAKPRWRCRRRCGGLWRSQVRSRMPPVTDFVLRTVLSAAEVERQLRGRLGAGLAGAERYWIQVRTVNAEQRADSMRDFGLEPTLTGSLQPRRGESHA